MNAPSPRADLESWLARSPFVAFLGLELVAFDPVKQTIDFRMRLRPELERSAGSGRVHGGVVSALIDTVGNFAVIMLRGIAPPTLNLRIDYLRPASTATLTARGVVRRLGRTIAFVDVDVLDNAGDLVAIGRANYAVSAASSASNG